MLCDILLGGKSPYKYGNRFECQILLPRAPFAGYAEKGDNIDASRGYPTDVRPGRMSSGERWRHDRHATAGRHPGRDVLRQPGGQRGAAWCRSGHESLPVQTTTRSRACRLSLHRSHRCRHAMSRHLLVCADVGARWKGTAAISIYNSLEMVV